METISNCFVYYESYSMDKIEALCSDKEIKGIILGDLFCNERMFKNGISDLILMMKRVLDSDKTLVYQAPQYVTSRNIKEVRSVLGMMDGSGKTSYVIVQDFGTAEMVANDFNGLKLIWGQFGRVRTLSFSDSFLGFLKEKNFFGFETADAELVKRLLSYGLTPFYTRSYITYKTMGRICYFRYQTDCCDPELCKKGCYRLKAENSEYEMSVDGFMMGKRIVDVPDETLRSLADISGVEFVVKE